MSQIHKTATVSSKTEIGNNVTIGPNAVIEADTKIDDNVIIGANCLVAQYTELKKDVKLFHGAVVGTVPQDLKFGGEKTKLIIGEGTTIREYSMLNRGTSESGKTSIGANCLLMAYSHVAHDCHVGHDVILANAVNLAGHIEIGDFVIIGGVVPVHQFVKIGDHAMIGGGYRVPQDVCPYALAGGYPLKIAGLNRVGLSRRGFKKETLQLLQKAFKILFSSNLNRSQAVEKIKAELEQTDEIKLILDFIKNSTRGMTI